MRPSLLSSSEPSLISQEEETALPLVSEYPYQLFVTLLPICLPHKLPRESLGLGSSSLPASCVWGGSQGVLFALARLNIWGLQSSQIRSFTAWNVLRGGGSLFIFYFALGMWKII